MNAEACETAARHLFGLMAPEDEPLFEAAAADDPALHEARRRVEEIACAVALGASVPAVPPVLILPRVKAACGLMDPQPPRRPRHLLTWAGWGVAAAIAAAALTAWPRLHPAFRAEGREVAPVPVKNSGKTGGGAGIVRVHEVPDSRSASLAGERKDREGRAATSPFPQSPAAQADSEKRRLIQELGLLRPELERFRQRDQLLFSAVPGRAWPLIVEMHPPGDPGLPSVGMASPAFTAAIGELLTGEPGGPESTSEPVTPVEPEPVIPNDDGGLLPAPADAPRAIPVYDPARDLGTLAVRNLTPAPAGSEYNLWVATGTDGLPVLAGTLPSEIQPSDSFDFNLGGTGFVPHSYYLTLDPAGVPAVPSGGNIVLQGP